MECINYEKMRYERAGRSGLMLPCVSLGMWHNFGAESDPTRVKKMVCAALDEGILHFDLANNYGPPIGTAEKTMGRLLSEGLKEHRDELLISTKAGYRMNPGPYGDGGGRKYLISSLDASLLRMGLDYVDIFYHHRPDPDTPLEETMGALSHAVKSGKALYIGLSNYDGETAMRASEILDSLNCPYVLNQNRYSILDRRIESSGLLDASRKLGVGIIAFSPLAQGLLTDRYLSGVPEDSRIVTDGRFLKRDMLTDERIAMIKALNGLALERGESLAQMALRWVISRKGVTSVLIGASNPDQIRQNARITEGTPLSDEELKLIDEIVKKEIKK